MSEKLPPRVITTEDGSSSIYLPTMRETYHSTHGAIQESQYVFIKMGLDYIMERTSHPRIFEMGMGTGLNVLLTYLASETAIKVEFDTIEAFPLDKEIIAQLNYTEAFEPDCKEVFGQIHLSSWGTPHNLSDRFTLTKYNQRIEDFQTDARYDLIYFDAFAPGKQAEVWQLEMIEKMASLLDQGGVLVTYCAQGQFKRNLRAAGFKVESLPGPPGKLEMTRGLIQRT